MHRLILSLCLVICLGACSATDSPSSQPVKLPGENDMTPIKTYSKAEIEMLARIKLPDSVIHFDSYVLTGGMDSFVALRFSLPATEISDMLSGAGYTQALEPIDYVPSVFSRMSDKIPEWPTSEKWKSLAEDKSVMLMGSTQSEAGFSRNIIVNQSRSDIYLVYLVHFEL